MVGNMRLLFKYVSTCGFLAAALLLSSCSPKVTDQPKMSINDWFDARYEEELQFSPISLSYMGRKDRNDELGDFSYAAFKQRLAWKQQTVEALGQLYDYESLTAEEQTSFDIWTYQYEQMVKAEPFFIVA